jgi:hypothetical protein
MLCKVTFVTRLLVAKKFDENIEGRILFLILFFFIEFHHLELSTPRTTPTSCIFSHVQEIHVFPNMYLYLCYNFTRPLFFPWETFLALISIGLY